MSFSDDTTLVDPQMLSTASDAGDTPSQSLFLDALSHDNGPNPTGTGEQHTWSRGILPTELSTSGATTDVRGESKANGEPVKTTGGPEEPRLADQATLTFVIAGQRVSESSELGILNEHPEALEKITSDARLDTSSFLIPTLQAAMGELRQSMKLQTAVRLSTVSLRMMAEFLPGNRALHSADGSREDLPRGLLESVRRELDRALPYYQWQGARNYCGRVQYIAALLEEGIRVLALPKEALTNALQLDVAAVDAIKRMAESIQHLGQTPADVCGVWVANTLLPASTLAKETDKSLVDESTISYASNGESEDLPSPSRLVPSSRVRGAVEGEIATHADTATPGSQADDPVYISDSEPNDEAAVPSNLNFSTPGRQASRQSSRSEALKEVHYDTAHHPQDKDLPVMRRRKGISQSTTEEGKVRAPPTKRRKVIKSSLLP